MPNEVEATVRAPFDWSIASERQDEDDGTVVLEGLDVVAEGHVRYRQKCLAFLHLDDWYEIVNMWPLLSELLKVASFPHSLLRVVFLELKSALSDILTNQPADEVCNLGRFVMSPNCTDYFALTHWLTCSGGFVRVIYLRTGKWRDGNLLFTVIQFLQNFWVHGGMSSCRHICIAKDLLFPPTRRRRE